jgi:FkbM family methyltransferase
MIAAARKKAAHFRWLAGKTWAEAKVDAAVLGWPAVVRLLHADRPDPRRRLRPIRLPGYEHPVHVRTGTSDSRVVRQVFAQREYACVGDLPGVEYVVDCGANVGCTTFYLLHRYPAALAVVVEPDPGNMEVCRKTLAPFGDRVTFIEAGVWSESVPMVVERGSFRDGAEWSIQVRPARPGEPADFQARTIPDVLTAAGFPRADVLKMDVEAAEEEVFRTGTDWLERVGTLVIELHGPTCEDAVNRAVDAYDYTTETSGELTVYRFRHGEGR